MSLWINNKRIVPAPLVSITKQGTFTDDGRLIGTNYQIGLRGTLLPNMGSPRVSGWHISETDVPNDTSIISVDDSHNALLLKQEYLRELFANTGLYFYYAPSGQSAVECYARLNSITFDPGVWVQTCNYNIDLSTNYLNKVGTSGVEDNWYLNSSGYGLTRAIDTFNIARREDNLTSYNISRTVAATASTTWNGSGVVGGEAWKNAKAWVTSRLTSFGMEDNYFNLPTGVASATGYSNFIEEEVVDKTAGSYSITQRYNYGTQAYIENRRVSRNTVRPLLGDLSPTIETITVNGSIQGFATGNSISGRLVNAYTYWNSIKDVLGTLVGAYGSGQTFSLDEDWSNGSLGYSMTFVNNTGSFYRHTYDVAFNNDGSSVPSVTINGQVEGVTLDGFWGPTGERFNAAITGWQTLRPTLKTLAFAYGNNTIFGSGLTSANFADNPIAKTISHNKPNGTISYSYTFGYTEVTGSQTYTNVYNIDISTQNAIGTDAGYLVSATINGVIQGTQTSDSPSGRFDNASSAWTGVLNTLYTTVSGYAATYAPNTPGIKNRPITRSTSINRTAGQIGYNFTYNNSLQASGTNVAQADISVEEVWPQDLTATQMIPGRAIGPIIQDLGTRTEYRRNVSVTLIMSSNGGNHWGFSDRGTPRMIASGYFSNIVSDLGVYRTNWWLVGKTENWDWKNGVFNAAYSVLAPSGG